MDPPAQLRSRHLGGYDDRKDRDQDHRRAVPLKQVEGGVERHADAARAHQAEHRRFAHVDVPAERTIAQNAGRTCGQ